MQFFNRKGAKKEDSLMSLKIHHHSAFGLEFL
jgi:hypothetical protein